MDERKGMLQFNDDDEEYAEAESDANIPKYFPKETSQSGNSGTFFRNDKTEEIKSNDNIDKIIKETELDLKGLARNDKANDTDNKLVSRIIIDKFDEKDIETNEVGKTYLHDEEDKPTVVPNDISFNGNIQEPERTEADITQPMIDSKKKLKKRKRFNVSESEAAVGFEGVLMELGEPGKFYWIQFLLHSLTTFCLSNTALVYIFTGFDTPHTCKKLENETELISQDLLNSSIFEVQYGKCDITVVSNTTGVSQTLATFGCLQGHDYKGYKHISFVAEWDLVCDNVGLKELVQTILMVGQTVGGLTFTSLADKYGRKPVFLTCNVLLGAAGLGSAFAPNIYILIVFRFLCGLFQQGTGLVSYTIMMEFLTARHRRVAGVLGGLFWTFSVMVLGLMAYIMKDMSWRMFQMACALFTLNVIVVPMFIYESPRWLIANKKYDQALAIIKRACRTNGKDYEKVKVVFERNILDPTDVESKDMAENKKIERYSLIDIVRHRTLLVSALIMWFVWITNSATYYGLFLTSSSLAGSRHLNFFLMAAADLPADVVNLFLFAYFGRKPVIMGWLVTAGSSLFTATMLTVYGGTAVTKTLSTVMSLVGKFGIGASFNSIFMYTPELFPTNLRSAGLGVCSSVSRLGGMIAPYSQALADVVLWGPGILFSAMCFASAAMFSKLPETRGQPMPSTIRDMKRRVTGQKQLKHTDLLNYEQIVLRPADSRPEV